MFPSAILLTIMSIYSGDWRLARWAHRKAILDFVKERLLDL